MATGPVKLGDKELDYSPDFRLYITTKLSNPHYTPEISTKATVVNFAVKKDGLEAQLLGIVVQMEEPELEEQKSAMVIRVANGKKQLLDLELAPLSRQLAYVGLLKPFAGAKKTALGNMGASPARTLALIRGNESAAARGQLLRPGIQIAVPARITQCLNHLFECRASQFLLRTKKFVGIERYQRISAVV